MATETTNYKLSKPNKDDFYNIEDFNGNFDKIDTILGNTSKFEKAGGTANAITLTGMSLEDGVSKTFIVSSNNNAIENTTINGKNLYKPGTTATPTLIKGKAVTVWYDSTGDCFFIKASAEGTATADKVLAGETFSNDNDTNIPGEIHVHKTMDDVTAESSWISPEVLGLKPPNGTYFDGGSIIIHDANFKSDNIKANTNVLGMQGKASVVDTADANVVAGAMLQNYSGYANGAKVAGNIAIGGNDEYAGWVRGNIGSVAPTNGRAHFYIPTGKYYNSTVNSGQQGVFADDPEFIASNILNTANIFGLQGTAVAGRRWASGTVASVTDVQYAFQGLTAGTNISDLNAASVPIANLGLSFVPRLILLLNTQYPPAVNGGYGVSIFFRDGFANGWPCFFLSPARHKTAPYDYIPCNSNPGPYTFIAYE